MKIKLKIISSLLLLSFLTPTTIKAIHLLDGHSHSVCNEWTTHVHKAELDCDIDVFQLNPIQTSYITFQLTPFEFHIKEPSDGYSFQRIHISLPNNQLRAPPALCLT